MTDIMKTVKFLEGFALSIKGFIETIQNKTNEQKRGFISILLGTLSANLLGNTLASKEINRAGDGIIRVGYGSKEPLIKNL